MNEIRMIHLADVHLGYTGPVNLTFREGEMVGGRSVVGRYVREVDIEQALLRMTRQIIEASPPVDIVVIAGDLFHRYAPLPRAIGVAANAVRRLVEHDIEVVILEGNHEVSRWLHNGSPISYLRELRARPVNGDEWVVIQGDEWRNPKLRGVLSLHALPWRAVEKQAFTGLGPIPGCINILVTHGRVQGMDDLNSLGHAASRHIPPDLLRRGWDYIALGEWHIHKRQPLTDAPAYYSGSLEALTFGEALDLPERSGDENASRGMLDVRLAPGRPPQLSTIENTSRRSVYRLKPIDAADLEPESLLEELRTRIQVGLDPEALVRLEVRRCPREVWEALDHSEIDRLRGLVRRCEIVPDIIYRESEESRVMASDTQLPSQWKAFLDQMLPDGEERAWYMEQGTSRIQAARDQVVQARVEAD